MQKNYGENKQNKREKSNRTNGLIITILFAAMDLILLGAFGKAGQALVDFFVGIFGYAFYGYSFAMTLVGVLLCANVKPKQNARIILLYAVIAVLVIIFAHILVSHNYALSGWGDYIKQSYDTCNTAGGAIASIFLYPFATRKIYILSLVTDGILATGLIVIAVLLQVNIDINLERFTRKKRNRIAKGQNANVGMFDVEYDRMQSGAHLNNNTVDGRDMGDNLSARRVKKRIDLGNYVPIDRINVSQEQDIDLYGDNFSGEDAQLILDTNEVKNEADRPELIYASDDVAMQDNTVDIARAQREIFGIDPEAKMNVIDEGMQDILPESGDAKPGERITQNYDPSRYAGFSTSERLRIMAENERNRQRRADGFSQSPEVSRPLESKRNDMRPSFSEQVSDMLNKKPEPKPNAEQDNIGNDKKEFDFKTLKNDAKSQERIGEESRPLDVKDIEQPSKDVRPVEDRSETRQIESMDEFIANMNKQKKNGEVPEIKNYDATKNVEIKSEKPQPSDGYFKKTFEPKPIAPKQPIVPKPPVSKAAEIKPAAKPEPEKKPEPKPVEKVKRSPYIPPSIDNLKDYVDTGNFEEDFSAKAKIIEDTYLDFGIEVSVKNIVSGPTVTRFEFEVLSKIDVQSIRKKADNLLMTLAVKSLRIEAPIPGKPLCGIEIPNAKRKTVGLKEFIENDEFKSKDSGLYFALGKDVDNNCHFEDLSDFPHLLVAGGTGSGKSVCLNTLLCSMLYKYSPEELRLVLVDPKSVEFSMYQRLPHMLVPKIYTTPKEALVILKWLVEEMERRYAVLKQSGVKNLSTYNKLREVVAEDKKLPYIVAIIDEVGDIMVSEYAKEFENLVITLVQKSRASGIHIILATQRPSVKVITGNIKNNLTTRIAFAVASRVDSGTILDQVGADKLLGKGDMLLKMQKLGENLMRLQNPFIDEMEIKDIIDDILEHNQAYYDESIESRIKEMNEPPKAEVGAKEIKEFDFPDDLIPDVLRQIAGSDKVSISGLQRAFSIGFSRGGKIYDWLLKVGYTEKTADNKCVCRLTSEEVEEIIEGARTGDFEE